MGKKTILGSNHQSTKHSNRSLVLKLICTKGSISRIDISRQTGLSKMSITNIANELINEGYIIENAENNLIIEPGKRIYGFSSGRKPVYLSPDTEKYSALGIYISRDYAAASLSNLKCERIYETRCSFAFEESDTSFIEKLKALVQRTLESPEASGKTILGIGAACIGPLDTKNGTILSPPNFHKLKSIHIKELLQEEFGYEVILNNDMNASALAEKLYGKGRDINNFVYVGVTNGIGAGIISDNKLFEGDMGYGGEIGHTTINFDGPKCACGNTGCLELYAGIPEIVSQAKSSVSLGMKSTLGILDAIEWEDIISCALAGDNLALNLIDRLCLYISIGLVSIANIFDPQAIFLGHDIALAGSLVTQKLQEYMNGKYFSSQYKKIPVEISGFGDRAPIAGSAAIVINKLFES